MRLHQENNNEISFVTGWRPMKPSAMPEATGSNRRPGLRLGHVISRRVERDSSSQPALRAPPGGGPPLFPPCAVLVSPRALSGLFCPGHFPPPPLPLLLLQLVCL